MRQDEDQQRKFADFLLRFLWGGLFVIAGVYTCIILLHQSSQQGTPAAGKEALIYILGGLALVSLGLVFVVRKVVETSFTQQLLSWGLVGSLSVYALVLGLIGFSPWVWGSFLGVMAAGLLALRPRPSQNG